MTTEISSSAWSETDASNNSAPPAGWPEGQAPSTVNDCARMMMGAIKRFWDRINGVAASTGSANAYVLTPTVALGAYVTGERFCFRANFANTGAATLNVSTLGTKSIFKQTGSGPAALDSGDIQNTQVVDVVYDGTQFQMTSPTSQPVIQGTGVTVTGNTVSLPNIGPGAVTTGNITTDAQGRVTAIVARDYIHLREEQAQNTAGGTFTSGAWRTRVLNTEVTDTGNLNSLAANQFTLAAGTYEIRASAPTFNVSRHQARLQNVTDSSTILVGGSNIDGTNTMGRAMVQGRFTIAGSKALELQHQCQSTESTDGFGVAANFTTEVYAVVEMWRVG